MVSLSQRERVAMIFRKKLPGWERTMRVVLGAIVPDVRHGRPQAALTMTRWCRALSRHYRGTFVNGAGCRAGAANWESAWPRFREMTLKTLHDDHTARVASHTRRSQ
jgi:hypothetical protein